MRLEIQNLSDEVNLPHGVEKSVQVKLLVQALVGVIKEFLTVFAPLVALHVLEAAEAVAEKPNPPGLSIRIVEDCLRAERLLEYDVRLLFGLADVPIWPLWRTQVDLADK